MTGTAGSASLPVTGLFGKAVVTFARRASQGKAARFAFISLASRRLRLCRYKKPGHKKQLRGTETILVLEDEVSVRHISVRVLRNLGYEVLEAAHGEDAKRIITKRNGAPKIDLLLTDMVMPEISGRQFVDWLGQTSPETKVIFISGYLEESMHPGDRRDPEMCFLAKPFSADELASKVRELLDGNA